MQTTITRLTNRWRVHGGQDHKKDEEHPPPPHAATAIRSLTNTAPVRLIVRYQHHAGAGAATTPGTACGLLCQLHNIAVHHRFEHAMQGVAIELGQHQIGVFAHHPEVLSIEPDVRVHTWQQQQPHQPWDMQSIGFPFKQPSAPPTPGVNVDVFVVDTGVLATHANLNVVEALCLVPGLDAADGSCHGTHVAGTIAAKGMPIWDGKWYIQGVAPGARIHSIKVLDSQGGGWMSTVMAGVDLVTQRKRLVGPDVPVVANLSLGSYTGTTNLSALDHAVVGAIAAGAVIVVAAGNDGMDCSLCSPAHVPAAIAVGSYGAGCKLSSFSNTGPLVALHAPGEGILSTFNTGGYGYLSGTSMAAPHVAGAAALFLAKNPKATPAEVKTALLRGARPIVTGLPLHELPGKKTCNLALSCAALASSAVV